MSGFLVSEEASIENDFGIRRTWFEERGGIADAGDDRWAGQVLTANQRISLRQAGGHDEIFAPEAAKIEYVFQGGRQKSIQAVLVH